ncbi:hypothetical protein HMPREF1285_01531 [Corynebacterium sp. KPL1859]|nr:hypothetical protein HMPREF1281_01689 [Corynebacterium sp. KPL1855]ERS79028.1 hypothetical protein HMPREF1285_01531 [Corynebacterium sp. KPL1859]
MFDGVEGGAGDLGGIGKLLLDDAQLPPPLRNLRAQAQDELVIAGGLSLFIARAMVGGHLVQPRIGV